MSPGDALLKKDFDSFSRLYDQYARVVFSLAIRILRSREDAEKRIVEMKGLQEAPPEARGYVFVTPASRQAIVYRKAGLFSVDRWSPVPTLTVSLER